MKGRKFGGEAEKSEPQSLYFWEMLEKSLLSIACTVDAFEMAVVLM